MAYTQRFTGKLLFAGARAREAGIDAFIAAGTTYAGLVRLEHLKLRHTNRVEVDVDTYAPASLYEPTLVALGELARFADHGAFDGELHLDGVSVERVVNGQFRSTATLPPAHHRWDILTAARHDQPDALRALHAQGVSLAVRYPELGDVSALHVAAAAPFAGSALALLELGAAVDDLAGDGTTPLWATGNPDVAKRLVELGADPRRVVNGVPLLVHACRAPWVVELVLLPAGVTIGPEHWLAAACGLAGAWSPRASAFVAMIARHPGFESVLRAPEVLAADHNHIVAGLLG